jgi:CspA family cold shock protein
MATGTIKWFNPTKGYGFIVPDDGGQDVFLHVSNLGQEYSNNIEENQAISYDIEDNKGKKSAVNVKVIEEA